MDRESLVFMAKLAEQTERYDLMVDHMKAVAQQPQELTVEERTLLSIAYNNVIGSRRASWRVISSIEQKGDADKLSLVREDRRMIETELEYYCSEILDIIKKKLTNSKSEEVKVFYCKMKGDYHRYLAEFQNGDVRKESAVKALEAYSSASSIATSDLPPTHPLRKIALGFSTLLGEVLNSPDRACHLAHKAFDDAIAELDTLSEESYKESALIKQLLKDNLTLWISDEPEQGDECVQSNRQLLISDEGTSSNETSGHSAVVLQDLQWPMEDPMVIVTFKPYSQVNAEYFMSWVAINFPVRHPEFLDLYPTANSGPAVHVWANSDATADAIANALRGAEHGELMHVRRTVFTFKIVGASSRYRAMYGP